MITEVALSSQPCKSREEQFLWGLLASLCNDKSTMSILLSAVTNKLFKPLFFYPVLVLYVFVALRFNSDLLPQITFCTPAGAVFVAVHTRISSQVNYASPLFTTLLLLVFSSGINSPPITLQEVCCLNFSDGGMLSPNYSLTPRKLCPSSLNHCNLHLFLPFFVFPLQFWNLCKNLSYPNFSSEMSSH